MLFRSPGASLPARAVPSTAATAAGCVRGPSTTATGIARHAGRSLTRSLREAFARGAKSLRAAARTHQGRRASFAAGRRPALRGREGGPRPRAARLAAALPRGRPPDEDAHTVAHRGPLSAPVSTTETRDARSTGPRHVAGRALSPKAPRAERRANARAESSTAGRTREPKGRPRPGALGERCETQWRALPGTLDGREALRAQRFASFSAPTHRFEPGKDLAWASDAAARDERNRGCQDANLPPCTLVVRGWVGPARARAGRIGTYTCVGPIH